MKAPYLDYLKREAWRRGIFYGDYWYLTYLIERIKRDIRDLLKKIGLF